MQEWSNLYVAAAGAAAALTGLIFVGISYYLAKPDISHCALIRQ